MEHKYRENYDGLMQLPIVVELKQKNRGLKKENRRLNRLVERLYARLERGFENALAKSHIEDFVEVVKSEVEKKPNIVYELVEDDMADVKRVYIKQEFAVVEEEAPEVEEQVESEVEVEEVEEDGDDVVDEESEGVEEQEEVEEEVEEVVELVEEVEEVEEAEAAACAEVLTDKPERAPTPINTESVVAVKR